MFGPTAWRTAARIVVPPRVTSPVLPCQAIVQPPHWMPRSLAAGPATTSLLICFESGRAPLLVLEQHERLPHALAGGLPVLGRADRRGQGGVGERMLREAHLCLDERMPPDGVVDPGLGNLAFLHQLLEQVDEINIVILLARTVGDHHHVDPGVDRLFDGRLVVARKLIDGRPVGDDEARESKLPLEQIGEQLFIGRASSCRSSCCTTP